MDAASACLMLGPLALYLVVIGAVNLRGRPVMISGVRDAAALGVALMGLILFGPAALLLPPEFVRGPLHWLLLAAIYLSGMALWLMFVRPRLVIYNLPPDAAPPLLMAAAQKLDADAWFALRTLVLPGRGVHARMLGFPAFRNTTLAATHFPQDPEAWADLRSQLERELARRPASPNPRGFSLALLGMTILAILTYRWIADPQEVTRQLLDLLGAAARA